MGRVSDANERLMDAALDLIWEESYGAVTIEDICNRADVRKGSFYYFFDSKAELAVAALERLWQQDWKPHMDAAFSPSVAPIDRLKNYLGGVYKRQLDIKARKGKILGCPVASVGSELSSCETTVCSKTREIISRKRPYVESAIRDAMADGTLEPGDPARRATVLISFLEGMVARARMMNDPEVLKDLPDLGMDILRVRQTAAPAAPSSPPAPAVTAC
ncbi:TetR/AcrR family transcriptional regulator [Opitutaceae bacterium EW11]|nr:TetR/AcrR family transcriptional regulator [Opitutaceae bacterium EW11]